MQTKLFRMKTKKMKNVMKKFRIYSIITLAVFFASSNIKAQSNVFYFMPDMQQSSLLNPALHNDSSTVTMLLPGLAGLGVNLSSAFSMSDLYVPDVTQNTVTIDLDRIYNNLSKGYNGTYLSLDVPVFDLGIRIGSEHKFSLSLTEKQSMNLSFDRDLIGFLKDGNAAYLGETLNFGISSNFDLFHEIGLGYSYTLDNKLTIGTRAKLLAGVVSYRTNNLGINLETGSSGEYLKLSTVGAIDLSGPIEFTSDDQNKISGIEDFKMEDPIGLIMNPSNMGVAFDLGAVYRYNQFTFSAAFTNLGGITWSDQLSRIKMNGSYTYEGIDLSNSINENKPGYKKIDDILNDIGDNLQSALVPEVSSTIESYDTRLPMSMAFGANYKLNNMINFGILDRTFFQNVETIHTLSLSANAHLLNSISLTGTYSIIDNNYSNLGAGVAFRLGPFQLYAVSENLLVLNGLQKGKIFDMRFGMNMLFGHKHFNKYKYL